MALNTITKSTLMSYAYDNIFSTIDNRSNVKDPKTNGKRQFVYHNDPWSKGQDYGKYPYIIVRFPEIDYDNQSLDSNSKDISWTHEVTVRTAMAGAINKQRSSGVTDMMEIIDDLNETFNSKSVKDQLRLLGHYNIKIRVVDNDEIVDDNSKHIFETTLEITYDTRKQVGV